MNRSEAIQALKTRTAPYHSPAKALSLLADPSQTYVPGYCDLHSLNFSVGNYVFSFGLVDYSSIDHPLGRYRSVPGYDMRGRRVRVETFLGSTWYPCWPSHEVHDALRAEANSADKPQAVSEYVQTLNRVRAYLADLHAAISALDESKPVPADIREEFDRVVSPTTKLDDNATKSEELISATKTANNADPYVELTGNLGGAKVLVPRSSLPCEIRLLNYGFDKCGTVTISERGNVYACMRGGALHDDPISIGLRDGRPIEAVMVSRA